MLHSASQSQTLPNEVKFEAETTIWLKSSQTTGKLLFYLFLIFEQKKSAGPQNMKDLFKFIYLFLVAAMDD